MPSLHTEDYDGFQPASVLLLLAGTGIVALPQIMAHREPTRMLGIGTARYRQLRVPIDLIHSCREDDLLLLPQIKQYCSEGMRPQHQRVRGLRHYSLLLTNEKLVQGKDQQYAPFKEYFNGNDDEANNCYAVLKDVPNAELIEARLNKRIIANALGRMTRPFRVVVSGPDAFNKAAREFLDACEVEPESVTVLSA